jgi:hypothetical protein
MLLPILLPLGLCPHSNFTASLPAIYIPESKQPLGLKSWLSNITTILLIQFMILGTVWLWQYLQFTNALVGIRIFYCQSLTIGTKWQYRLYYEIIFPFRQSQFITHISQNLYHSYNLSEYCCKSHFRNMRHHHVYIIDRGFNHSTLPFAVSTFGR